MNVIQTMQRSDLSVLNLNLPMTGEIEVHLRMSSSVHFPYLSVFLVVDGMNYGHCGSQRRRSSTACYA